MKVTLDAYVKVAPETYVHARSPRGAVRVVLDGPDDAVQRIVDLGLCPFLANDNGPVVGWFSPGGRPHDEDLFGDISLGVLVGDERLPGYFEHEKGDAGPS